MRSEGEWQRENEENSTIERLENERRELNGKMMVRVDYGVEGETDGREEGRKGGRTLEGLHIDRRRERRKRKSRREVWNEGNIVDWWQDGERKSAEGEGQGE